MQIEIDQQRLMQEIDTLATISDVEPPAVTRIVFSEQDLRARAWLKERFSEAGLSVREDAAGNVFARWQGARSELPAVATGSHIDAIPYAGKFDGVVGVLGGLEAIRALHRSGFRPARSIELIQFTSEEPTRFGVGCLGSRLLSGVLNPLADDSLRDRQGDTLKTVRMNAGFNGELSTVRLPQGFYSAFLELHIEQGPILDRENITIGVVTDIAAPASFTVTLEGEGGHAGSTFMPGRRDALCAASELILEIERLALSSGSRNTVATVGTCEAYPGAINSIPSRVKLGVDLRDTDGDRRDMVLEKIRHGAGEISQRRQIKVEMIMLNADPPASSSPRVLSAINNACSEAKVSSRQIVSRAYHDSLFMSRIAPMAMIFIPCRNGISHRPDEHASVSDIADGVEVLARSLAELSCDT
ncbi:M20 family metallo-hydrolase [Alloacidobacterium dinghuense]|uniref:M20 family metallo-hydrolase n=1 Tax=Alloacidobacterium dinghuense TaxID=2763107 RepID=A0A7G8BK01_9BACT|nr:M20 family metallo-hydrolase [Alloacidobacterium dinghuense]QNI32871.1 M20 family metallo-hydrolase [Alloacidobacterium dinghuense]